MTWAYRIRLASRDAVFAGQEASLMREIVEKGMWPESPKRLGRNADLASLQEQAQLVQRLSIKESEAVAAGFGLSDFGAAGAAVLAAADLNAAVKVMNSFAPLLNLRHEVRLHVRENDVAMMFHDHVADEPGLHESLISVDIVKMLRFLRDLFCAEPIWPEGELSATGCADVQSKCCKDMVRRAGIIAHRDHISIPTSLASQNLPLASSTRLIAHQRECRGMMRDLDERALCESVRRILLQSPDASPSVVQVARQLGMSTRTFRRRLASQRTTFARILDEVRFQLAVRYLEDRRLTTEHIAQKLGYSESANFRAAFRRWTGSSPRHFDVQSAATARGR